MRTIDKVLLAFTVLSLVLLPVPSFTWAYYETGSWSILSLFAFLAIVVYLVRTVYLIRRDKAQIKRLVAVLFLVIIVTFWLNGLAFGLGRELRFEQQRTLLEQTVQLNSNQLSTRYTSIDIPDSLKERVLSAAGREFEDSSILLELITCRTFPAQNLGFAYCDGDNALSELKSRWIGIRRMDDNWYAFSG